MNRLFRTTVVETSGVRTISGGGTNASNPGQALLNLSGVSLTGNQTITGVKTFQSELAGSKDSIFQMPRQTFGNVSAYGLKLIGGNFTGSQFYGENVYISGGRGNNIGGSITLQAGSGTVSSGELAAWGQLFRFNGVPIVDNLGNVVAPSTQGIINTTYSTLTGLKSANNLLSGQYYRISDFHLTWRNQSINDNNVKSGLSPEPLIVLALSRSGFSHEAKSELYPQDTIYYDIDASGSYSWGTIGNNTAIPNFKGWIYRRIDHKFNIDIPWDWRHITVNCCRPHLTGIGLYNTGTTYNLYDVVKNVSDKLYYSVQNSNTNNSLTNLSWWLPVSDFTEGSTYFVTDESFGFRAYNKTGSFVNLPADTGTRIQQPTFTSSLVSQGTFQLTNCNNIKIGGGYSNVFSGSLIYNNTIENNFHSNTIGNNFNSNTIGSDFNLNTIGNSFNGNAIGNNFDYNTIRNNFEDNTIENSFGNNTVGNSFNNNTIGLGFYSNTIGRNFRVNTIINSFFFNTIRSDFVNNTIGVGFSYNTIGNSFNNNTIGNIFDDNTVGNTFRRNTVEDSNTIGNVTGATHIYNNYNTRIFSNSNNTVRLSYFNANDQLVVTDPTA
jgi:hypothetical protein